MSSGLEVEAYLYGALHPTRHDQNVLIHALNERFMEQGRRQTIPYTHE